MTVRELASEFDIATTTMQNMLKPKPAFQNGTEEKQKPVVLKSMRDGRLRLTLTLQTKTQSESEQATLIYEGLSSLLSRVNIAWHSVADRHQNAVDGTLAGDADE